MVYEFFAANNINSLITQVFLRAAYARVKNVTVELILSKVYEIIVTHLIAFATEL